MSTIYRCTEAAPHPPHRRDFGALGVKTCPGVPRLPALPLAPSQDRDPSRDTHARLADVQLDKLRVGLYERGLPCAGTAPPGAVDAHVVPHALYMLDEALAERDHARAELERAHSALRGADPWRPVLPDAETLARTRHEIGHARDPRAWTRWDEMGERQRYWVVEAAGMWLAALDRCLAEPAQESSREHPEAVCGFCGGPNIVWVAPSPLWNAVMRGGSINGVDRFGGIVCPACFARLAEEAGIAEDWRLTAERVHVELETVTPSGRVWDERTWLWRESSGEVRETASPASVTDEMVRAYVRAHNQIYGTDGGEGWPRPIDAVRAGLAAVLSLLADQGRAPNRCKACGTFRLDGAPPVLHKCLTCGFEGSAELHQRCPGCAGEHPEVPRG